MFEIITAILIFICIIIFNILFLKKKGSYQYATQHVVVYSCMVVIFVCYFFIFDGLSHFKNRATLEGIVDNIISNYVVVVFIVFFYIFEKWMKNRAEDKEKLRQDYDALAEKYNAEKLIRRSDDSSYPVVELGSFNIRVYDGKRMVGLDQIHIEDSKNTYKLPRIIENNFLKIMSAHDTSTLFNNKNIRMIKMEVDGNRLFLTTERTFYFYSLVTNRAPDYEWAGMTVREMFEPGPWLQPMELSDFSNHLGFNGFLESLDGYIVFVKRSENVSIGKCTYGDSVGASLKAKYALDNNGFFTGEGLVNAVLREIENELKIDVEKFLTVNLIGAYRDAVECGKPQLLFYAKATVSAKEISENFYREIKNKHQRKEVGYREKKRQAAEQKVLEDGTNLVWIKTDDLMKVEFKEKGIQVPDGSIFAYNHKINAPIPLKEAFLPMVPSAAASIKILQHFFKNNS